MRVKQFLIAVCMVLSGFPIAAQTLRTGLLAGGSLGLINNLEPRSNVFHENGQAVQYAYDYQYGISLGYRFRIENERNDRLFYDLDAWLNGKVFEWETLYLEEYNGYRVKAISHDASLALAVSPSVNYKLIQDLRQLQIDTRFICRLRGRTDLVHGSDHRREKVRHPMRLETGIRHQPKNRYRPHLSFGLHQCDRR